MRDLQALSLQKPGLVITETSPGEANTATLRPEEARNAEAREPLAQSPGSDAAYPRTAAQASQVGAD